MRVFASLLACAIGITACAPGEQANMEGPDAPVPGQDGGIVAIPYESSDYLVQNIGDRIFFAVDSSALSNEAEQTLSEQVRWLRDNSGYRVTIEGHADERGTREYNLALGARRAETVRSFLIQNGVSATRLTTVSYGKERPELPCSFEQCWSQNRRAVTVSVEG